MNLLEKFFLRNSARSLRIVLPISLLFFAVLVTSCNRGGESPAPSGAGKPGGGMPPPEVNVITVAPSQAVLTTVLPGRLQAVRTAQLRARVEGVVEKILFTEGSEVTAGTSLFKIDARTYKATAAAARADAELARTTLERYEPLLAIKAVSQQDFDAASAKLKLALAAKAKADLDLENAEVIAPISGHIGRALVTEGALVGRGDATPLATIDQLDPIYVNFSQSEEYLKKVRKSMSSGRPKAAANANVVQLIDSDGSVYPLNGKLLFTDLTVDPETGSVLMRARFPNPKRELLPGAFVQIKIPVAIVENSITVPQRAVQLNGQGHFVLLVKEGKVVERTVKVSRMAGLDWLVDEGLETGDQVIVDGLQKARPGSLVKVVSLTQGDPGDKPVNQQSNKPAASQ